MYILCLQAHNKICKSYEVCPMWNSNLQLKPLLKPCSAIFPIATLDYHYSSPKSDCNSQLHLLIPTVLKYFVKPRSTSCKKKETLKYQTSLARVVCQSLFF